MAGKRLIVLAFLALVMTGCSNSASGPVSPGATSTGQSQSGTLPPLASPDTPMFSVNGAETAGGRGACVFDPATGQFTCPDQSRDGITFTRRFTLYDAKGAVQSAFDPKTTASIKTETTANGTTSRGDATVTLNRRGTMTTTGLGSGATTHTLNGSEQGTVVVRSPSGSTNTSINDATTDLVVPVRSRDGGPAYPLSGVTVHATVTTTTRGSETRTVTTRRQETFNGTNIVQVEITVDGATARCTYDLAAHTSTCARR
ncbi:MAG: hypothetical protein A3H96_03345 [Acidobacteria bacterium RIFCSPLOWO2_02_FULL_67_36]|nr:MAG: hypothetical protein A3H96_03345 [Acidobacteria bacterium RIFCSPLOWO2_02_FULL_67_36]OFW22749.1 MAG: hypothetical protein A3G21_26030 [Acidobacteria bacterium RIFCSPLOWO2_12_FULL_66_21]